MRSTRLLGLALFGTVAAGLVATPVTAQETDTRKTYPVPHVLEVIRTTIAAPAPKGLSAGDAKEYAAETAWLITVRDRLETSAVEYGVVSPRDAASGLPTGKRQHKPMEVTIHFDAIRKTFEAEGARFNTLSNASRARHDIAMNAIRNMKG